MTITTFSRLETAAIDWAFHTQALCRIASGSHPIEEEFEKLRQEHFEATTQDSEALKALVKEYVDYLKQGTVFNYPARMTAKNQAECNALEARLKPEERNAIDYAFYVAHKDQIDTFENYGALGDKTSHKEMGETLQAQRVSFGQSLVENRSKLLQEVKKYAAFVQEKMLARAHGETFEAELTVPAAEQAYVNPGHTPPTPPVILNSADISRIIANGMVLD